MSLVLPTSQNARAAGRRVLQRSGRVPLSEDIGAGVYDRPLTSASSRNGQDILSANEF